MHAHGNLRGRTRFVVEFVDFSIVRDGIAEVPKYIRCLFPAPYEDGGQQVPKSLQFFRHEFTSARSAWRGSHFECEHSDVDLDVVHDLQTSNFAELGDLAALAHAAASAPRLTWIPTFAHIPSVHVIVKLHLVDNISGYVSLPLPFESFISLAVDGPSIEVSLREVVTRNGVALRPTADDMPAFVSCTLKLSCEAV